MKSRIISSLLLGTALTLAAVNFAAAQDKNVKIGSLSDQSGLYADLGGPGSTLAAQMAVEDSGMTAKGWKIDVISGDHQNKPDVGVNIARQWFDVDKVDVIVDVPNSGVALAVNNIVKEKNGVLHQFRRRYLGSDQRAVHAEHRSTGPTTPTRWPTAPARRWRRPAAIPGSSSPPTMPSARRWSATPPRPCRRQAARCSAASSIR